MTRIYDMNPTSFSANTRKMLDEMRESLPLSIPAIVTKTSDYESLQCVSVEFAIKDIFPNKADAELGTVKLEKVFVKLLHAGGFKVKCPVHKGDIVTLQWSHKDLGKFLDGSGDVVSQSINEIADLEDCWVELGFGTRKNHTNPSVDNFIIEGEGTLITITPSGNITVNTDGNVRMVAKGSSYLKSSHHTIDTNTTITKNLEVKGNTEIKGTTDSRGAMSGHAGVFASTFAGLGGSAASFNVDMNINGTVTINGININTHTHQGVHGKTSPPQ